VLHGVMIDGEKSRAYLEDPVAKRVFGYAVGDPIGGGRLQEISPDRVLIARPEGTVEVLLRDPSKPKPAPAGPPGVPPAPVAAPAPGVLGSTPGAAAAVMAPARGSTSGQQVENAPPQSPPTAPAPPPRQLHRQE